MAGYYGQIWFGYSHTPCIRRSSPQEEEEENVAQQPPTDHLLMKFNNDEISPTSPYSFIEDTCEEPQELEKPQVKSTYHEKKKTQSYHQQTPATNESN